MSYMGDYNTGATVRMMWSTSGTDGSSITRATDGTLKIYKDGSATERTSLAGVTQTEDFDSATGLHCVIIDTSDNTDAGFYAAGHDYHVVMTGMVIDGKTVNAAIGHFSIANRSNPINGGNWSVASLTADSIATDSMTIDGPLNVTGATTLVDFSASSVAIGGALLKIDASGYFKISEGTGTGQLKTTSGKPWALDSNGAVFDSTAVASASTIATAVWAAATRSLTSFNPTTVANPFIATKDLAAIPTASAHAVEWTIVDRLGNAVSLSGKTVRCVFGLVSDAGDEDDTTDDTLTASFAYETSGSGIVVSGTGSNIVTLTHDVAKTATAGQFRYWLWNTTDKRLLVKGLAFVEPALQAV